MCSMWYLQAMSRERFTTHVGDRGRFVVPAEVRRRLQLEDGDLLVIDVNEEDGHFIVRKAADVAHGLRGYLNAGGRSLSDELIEERRAEARREAGRIAARR
jgi:AbrB family looped-hinge helix DNA binding protein